MGCSFAEGYHELLSSFALRQDPIPVIDRQRLSRGICLSHQGGKIHRVRSTIPISQLSKQIEASLAEIAHALDELGATGIGLMTGYGNRWLGHPDFAPVLAELDRRGAAVHVHPRAPPCCAGMIQSNPWGASALLEFPFDTGRTMFDLLQSGALRRYPHIRWIFSHLGGVIPFLAGRLRDVGPGFWLDLDTVAPEGIDHEFRRLHYDTAACANAPAMQAGLAYLPASQMLFGTDHPHYDVAGTVDNFSRLGLADGVAETIQRDNPRRLLRL